MSERKERKMCCRCGKFLGEVSDVHTCYDILSVCPDLDPLTREKILKLREDREKVIVSSRRKKDVSDDGARSNDG